MRLKKWWLLMLPASWAFFVLFLFPTNAHAYWSDGVFGYTATGDQSADVNYEMPEDDGTSTSAFDRSGCSAGVRPDGTQGGNSLYTYLHYYITEDGTHTGALIESGYVVSQPLPVGPTTTTYSWSLAGLPAPAFIDGAGMICATPEDPPYQWPNQQATMISNVELQNTVEPNGVDLNSSACGGGDVSTANTAQCNGSYSYIRGSSLSTAHTWLRFTASSTLPTITSASISLTCWDRIIGQTGITGYSGRRLITSAATWNRWDGASFWTTPGGTDTAQDRYVTSTYTGSPFGVTACDGSTTETITLDPSEITVISPTELVFHFEPSAANSYLAIGADATLHINGGAGTSTPPNYFALQTFDGPIVVLDPLVATSTSFFSDALGAEAICDRLMATSSFLGITYSYPTGSGIPDCITDVFRYLFYPTGASLETFKNSSSFIASRAPFGYASQVASGTRAIFDPVSSSSTTVTFLIPPRAYTSSSTTTLQMFDTGEWQEKAEPLLAPIRLVLSVLLWMGFCFALYEWAIHHAKP